MTTEPVRLVLCAALLCATAGVAEAGDPRSVTMRGSYSERVAHVPAPAPIPEYKADYYVELHTGFAFSSSGTIATGGDSVVARSMSETSNLWNAGISVGRYFGGGLRGSLSLDFRPEKNVVNDSGPREVTHRHVTADGDRVTSRISMYDNPDDSDSGRYQFQTGLANVFYDFERFGRFRPYLGAGAGAVLYTFDRNLQGGATCLDQTIDFADPLIPDQTVAAACAATHDPTRFVSNSKLETTWGYALALMAGVGIQMHDNLTLDLGYRALYTSGTAGITLPSVLGGSSTVKIEDRLDHELRVGLRWDID
ncbi:MAG: outer membrane protein [Hyphomicrobiaceae bacterium]